MEKLFITVAVTLLSSLLCNCQVSSFDCASTQFLEYEKTGIITCKSSNPFYGIYWYNSTDSANNPPFLYRDNSEGKENAYSMKGYEISDSGSLVIHNVSIRDEHLYRAVLIYDESSGQIEIRDINVIVIAKPASQHPVIESCSSERFCFSSLEKNATVKCSVEDSRPEVSLQWSIITEWNETVLFSEPIITKGAKWFTSSTQITLSLPARLVLLACKTIYPPGILPINVSFILIENLAKEVSLYKNKSLQAPLGSQMILKCPSRRKHVLKWEKIYENGTQVTLGFAFLSQVPLTKAYHGYHMDLNGNLILSQAHIEHEGMYSCYLSDGKNDGVLNISVRIYANPEPGFLNVRGCEKQALKNCVLLVQKEGTLTCTLNRIRPVVQIEFDLLAEADKEQISFVENQDVTKNSDGTFNISLTISYHLLGNFDRRLTVRCRAKGPRGNWSTVFYLHFMDEDGRADSKTSFNFLWLCLLLGLCLMLIGLSGVVCMIRFHVKKKTKSSFSNSEQFIPMLPTSHHKASKIAIFIQELKHKYEKLYTAILPVPFIRKDQYCVDSVFVESSIELQTPHQQPEWKRLKSYNDLFALEDLLHSKRMLVLGEPGIGKSTLTLQIVYDWCNKEESSVMKNVGILILLPLRHLRGTHSIYESIRLLLLPLDTTLTTDDVKSILQESNSVYLVLDGFDECVDQKINAFREVENIIKADMFQNFHVLVCTRPSCLPNELPPKTSRVTIKGFDDNAQEQYIKKAITLGNTESTKHVMAKLKENIILLDFCQIPLFFVMYAHLTYEFEVTENLNSVTSFFRYIITCCYAHYDNKTKVESSLLSEEFKENYKPISEVAFNGLFGERRIIVWDKKELERILGSELYHKYTHIGIFVEDEVLEVSDEPGTSSAKHVFYKAVVRFYHKLFCEWYAAHYVADVAGKSSEADFLSVLNNVYDTNQEYIFRFACGINPACADKIIKYLTERREENRLAILCLLEKTGSMENITNEISSMCQKQILLSANDARIVQRSTTQLLEIASKNKIAISNICLRCCFKSVNLVKEHIVLTSGITLSKLRTVRELELFAEENEFDLKEVNDIMRYCILCGSVQKLMLKYCLLPECLQTDTVMQKDRNSTITVIWSPNLFRKFVLDIKSGFWMDKEGRQLDHTGYLEEVASFRAKKRNMEQQMTK